MRQGRSRSRRFLLAVLVAAFAVAPGVPGIASAAPGKHGLLKAPAALAFYQPPAHLPAGHHGGVIWERRASAAATLAGGARTTLVLYRSTAPDGKPIAVSGLVSVPRGRPPKGGWPVITYAHATTGIADACAPSRDSPMSPAHAYIDYVDPVLDSWLAQGYAVVQTDYPGLGTPGTHPYLIGVSEGRSVLDMVRAARQLDPRIGPRFAIAGHSQGGHAALWAAALAPSWVPELQLVGTVAFAPASHTEQEIDAAGALTTPSADSALGALIVVGAATASPALELAQLLSPQAQSLLGQVASECLPALGATDSWGGLAPSAVFAPGADLTLLNQVLAANDPGQLKISSPVLIVQGTSDTTVLPGFTTALVGELQALGDSIDYQTLAGVDHAGVVSAGAAMADTWLTARFGSV